MKNRCRSAVYAAMMLLLVLAPGVSRAGYDYVDISNPFLRKIPIAVPQFKPFSGTPEEMKLARSSSQLLAETLAFTGYFKILDPASFLFNPQKDGIVAPRINFKNWTTVGAELLITGGLVQTAGLVEMELRLYDTFKEKLLLGKRYKGALADQRRIIRRFCSEVIYKLTGHRGIFGSKIAFVSTTSGNKEIYICDFDGYRPHKFTNNRSINLTPMWSSDGKWIAYTSYAKGNPDLYIKNVREKRGTVVARKGINISPCWVPGKFELSATLSFTGDQEIYLLTGRGKIIKKLTNNRGIDVSASWSPDGKKMAFVSKRSGTPQIYIKSIVTGEVRRLTYEGKHNTQPNWSPKGDRIAYTAIADGEINIRVIGVDGNGLIQLTEGQGDNESPSWSPDGSLIVFSTNREGPSRLYVMTSYGTDQRRLLEMPGEQSEPNWSPNIEGP